MASLFGHARQYDATQQLRTKEKENVFEKGRKVDENKEQGKENVVMPRKLSGKCLFLCV